MIPGLVSCLVPTKGFERLAWLGEAIRSIEAQSLPPERWQLIVVRDAADPPMEREVPPLPPRSHYVRAERPGLSAALNRAAALAKGEFLTVVQDDDWIFPQKLEAALALFAARPEADVVFSLPWYTDADGLHGRCPERLRDWLRAHQTVSVADLRAGAHFLVHGTATVYRRAAWERAGPWDESLATAEEWEYHLRLLASGALFCGQDEVTTAYRQHSGQKTGTVKTRHGSFNRRRTVARLEALRTIRARYADLLPAEPALALAPSP